MRKNRLSIDDTPEISTLTWMCAAKGVNQAIDPTVKLTFNDSTIHHNKSLEEEH